MPQTIEQLAFTTVALAVGLVLCFFAVRRWGTENGPDPVAAFVVRLVAPSRAQRTAAKSKAKPKAKPVSPKAKLPIERKPWPTLKLKPRFGPEDERAEEPERVPKPEPTRKRAPEPKAKVRPKAKPRPKPKPKPKPRPERKRPVTASAPPIPDAADTTDIPVLANAPRSASKPKKPKPRKPKPRKPKPAPRPLRAKSKGPMTSEPPTPSVAEENEDHVPLSDAASQPEPSDEPKVAFRKRFRRGLKRTRERFGREMRTALFMGATPEAFEALEEALIAADVGLATSTALVDELRAQVGISKDALPGALRSVMVGHLASADRRLRLVRGRLSVWLVAGVNGTGKTTTIAKLGARAKELGLNVCLAAADTFRAAGVEQLQEWGKRLGIDVVHQKPGADPGAVVFDAIAHARASGQTLLIVDTAGRLHTKKPLMEELQKVLRVIEREEEAVLAECLLVIDATTGQNGIAQARAFGDAVKVSGLVLSKLDGTAKGGIAFAVEDELAVPVKAVGVGESATDLVPFDPETFVDALIGSDEEEDDAGE